MTVVISCCSSIDPGLEQALAARSIRLTETTGVPDHLRNDADFIALRLIAAAERCGDEAVAYVGCGAAAAGAIIAAALRPDLVSAVVAINARTDRAFDHLRQVRTPTFLLITEMPVLLMNREAVTMLRGEKRIEVVHGDRSGATVAEKAARWLAANTLIPTAG